MQTKPEPETRKNTIDTHAPESAEVQRLSEKEKQQMEAGGEAERQQGARARRCRRPPATRRKNEALRPGAIRNRKFGMSKKLKPGDKVEWETSQGKTLGTVRKKLTSPTKIKTHQVAASKENPEYLVTSDKSGKPAAHKPAGLKKR